MLNINNFSTLFRINIVSILIFILIIALIVRIFLLIKKIHYSNILVIAKVYGTRTIYYFNKFYEKEFLEYIMYDDVEKYRESMSMDEVKFKETGLNKGAIKTFKDGILVKVANGDKLFFVSSENFYNTEITNEKVKKIILGDLDRILRLKKGKI